MDASQPRLTARYSFRVRNGHKRDELYIALNDIARKHAAVVSVDDGGGLTITGTSANIQLVNEAARRLKIVSQFFCTSPASSPTKEVRKP